MFIPHVRMLVLHQTIVRSTSLLIMFVLTLAPRVEAQETGVPAASSLRLEAAKIKVTDLADGMAFYRDVVGFSVLEDADHAVLNGGSLPIVLEPASERGKRGFPRAAQMSLTLQSPDILATMARLKAQGISFLNDPPTPFGLNKDGTHLGLATKFEDPFGNIISLVEQQRHAGETFEGLRIYNAGFYLPEIEKAQAFYEGLGFITLTENYYPNLVMGYPDHSFAFMLHGHENVDPAPTRYPVTAQLLMVFSTSDLEATIDQLTASGVTLLFAEPQENERGRYTAFQDPFGNVSEIYEQGSQPAGKLFARNQDLERASRQ